VTAMQYIPNNGRLQRHHGTTHTSIGGAFNTCYQVISKPQTKTCHITL